MAATKKATAPSSRARAKHSRTTRNVEGVERIDASLKQVQEVLSTVRGDVQSGARSLVDDVERMVKDARRDLTSLSKALTSDAENLQKAVTEPQPRKRAKPRPRRPKASTGAKQ